jgi:hypothetical protein
LMVLRSYRVPVDNSSMWLFAFANDLQRQGSTHCRYSFEDSVDLPILPKVLAT